MRFIRNWYQLLEGSGLVANDSGPGAAHGALAANVTWCPFYSPPFSTLTVTGTLSPDATGTYQLSGSYNSRPYWKSSSAWYLWWQPTGPNWVISEVLGTEGSRGWLSFGDDITQLYGPYGTATGNADVTCPYTLPYDQKGVTLGLAPAGISSAAAGGLNIATGSFEMLIRPNWTYTDGLYHYFWDTYDGTNTRFRLYKNTDNTTILYINSTYKGVFTFAWTAHTLYHIVFNWPASTLYVNNVLVKTFTTGTLGDVASNLFIGSFYLLGYYPMTGDILYFITRDVPLTVAEITAFNAFFQNLYIPQIT